MFMLVLGYVIVFAQSDIFPADRNVSFGVFFCFVLFCLFFSSWERRRGNLNIAHVFMKS